MKIIDSCSPVGFFVEKVGLDADLLYIVLQIGLKHVRVVSNSLTTLSNSNLCLLILFSTIKVSMIIFICIAKQKLPSTAQ